LNIYGKMWTTVWQSTSDHWVVGSGLERCLSGRVFLLCCVVSTTFGVRSGLFILLQFYCCFTPDWTLWKWGGR